MKHTSSRSGFTLIELLVVISIIALLAGLAFPALQGALDTAKKAQASTMVNQLATAITMYNTEYGTWPVPSGNTGTADYQYTTSSAVGDLCLSLNGNKNISDAASGTSTIPNTRGIQFMSFNKKDLVTGSSNEIQNPFTKASKRQYWVYVDANYDNVVKSVPNPATGSTGDIVQGVAVWCYGDKDGTVSKMITSFK